jgi:hypothetical protein
MGVSTEDSVFAVKEPSKDGTESREAVRENGDPELLSPRETLSMSRSSGALNSKSRGLLPRFKLNSFSASCDRSITDSTVILFSAFARRCRFDLKLLGGGMFVTARRAATEAGIASGE